MVPVVTLLSLQRLIFNVVYPVAVVAILFWHWPNTIFLFIYYAEAKLYVYTVIKIPNA